MNYELAKQLKDAGFPQGEIDLYEQEAYLGQYVNEKQAYGFYKNAYAPSISELIEACGEDFRTLVLHTQYTKKLEKPWEAVPNKKRRPACKGQKAKNPTEAVAKLWLELNKHEK